MPNLKPYILVTGGTGLVGAHLLAYFCQKKILVRAIFRNPLSIEKTKKVLSYYSKDYLTLFEYIEWFPADINDIPALKKAFLDITEVYHCAALVSFKKSDYDKMRKVNIEGTSNLVNLALHFKIKKFCYVSSIATLDKNPNSAIIDEQNEWNPDNNNYGYAISKYGGEMEVWRAAQEGLKVIIVNPGVILGSGFWNENTGRFFSNAESGFKFFTMGKTGFVGVKDVVKAMIQLMQSDIENERFILVSENKSYQHLLSTIAKAMNKPVPFIKITPIVSEMAWRLSSLISFITRKNPMITKQSARASHQKTTYSSIKIEKELDFKFESLERTIENCAKDYFSK